MLALLPWRYIAAFLALTALLGGIWFHGHHAGVASVQAKWDAQVVADKEAEEARAESNRLRSSAAATTYETQRAAITARLTKPAPEAAYALHATICPPSGALGKPLELGDVPIPAVWLDRLRDAGADYAGH